MSEKKIDFSRVVGWVRDKSYHLMRLLFFRENKIVLYIVLTLFVCLILLILFFLVISKEKSEKLPENIVVTQSKVPQEKKVLSGVTSENDFYAQPQGELSNIIQKANILYNNGKIEEALDLFRRISLYSQTLANYNLGVIALQRQKYGEAINSFKEAIDGGDDIALSAINAAYGAFQNKNEKEFNDFLKLADASLADFAQAPLYSYLYSLVSYYKNQYFEALSPLLHPTSSDYASQNHALASEMFLMLGDDYSALEQLKKDTDKQNLLALGLLYARNGDYLNAKVKLGEYLADNPENIEALSALELVDLKLQNYAQSAETLKAMLDKKKKPFFKISVGLSSQLFDINAAQKSFWNRKFEHRRSLQYKILFYYAPFKVFNAKKAFRFFSEGEFDWLVGNIDEATDSYLQGENVSRINKSIAEGLREAYFGDLRKALQMLLKNAKTYFQHSVLYYDIGLLYAQLGDFENAYSYFSKAYYLNRRDTIAGIFSILTGKMTYQDVSRFETMLTEDLTHLGNEDEGVFLSELFTYATDNKFTFFDLPQTLQKSIHLAFQAVSAMEAGNLEKINAYFSKLQQRYPDDLTTNMMFQVAKNYGGNLKEISLRFSAFFREGSFSNMHSLYYGGSLCRELYVYLAFITGNLSYAITHLQNKLTTEENSSVGTMQTLGLAYIYNQEFEKAFAVYNNLIDRLGEQDSRTKFLGAVSAIGAGHYNNAVALLQISKLDSVASLESRYALALLYQQMGNLESAASLLQSVSNKEFISEFFDFTIDTSEILKKAQR